MKTKKLVQKITIHILLIVSSIIVAFPFFWMFSNSLKTKDEIWQMPPKFLPSVAQWVNYADAIGTGKFLKYMWNSTYTAIIITVLVLINSAMFAYALVNIKFVGKKYLFALIMATYIMPSACTHIPSYIILSKMGLINTYTGYIISNLASVFNIFYFRTSFTQINRSIMDSARVDGASHWSIFWKITVPMSRSSFATLGVLSFVGFYNSYKWPSLILRDPDKYFVSMGLKAFFTSEGAYGLKWGAIMAACCVTILPLLLIFFFGQKWIINGITNDSAGKE